jgi:hypothetical protein
MILTEELSVSPESMVFALARGARSTLKLRLLNRGTRSLGFKVKTTQRMRYTVKPSQGLVKPSETAVVTVTLSKDECESLLYNAYRMQREIPIKDKFQVHWIAVEGDVVAKAERYQRKRNSKRLVSALAPLWEKAKQQKADANALAALAAGKAADDATAKGGGAAEVAAASSVAYDAAAAAAAAAYASISLQCQVEYPSDGLLDPYMASTASSPSATSATSPLSAPSPRWGGGGGGGFGGSDLSDELSSAGSVGSTTGSEQGAGGGARETIVELLRLRRSNVRMEQMVLGLEVEKATLGKSLETSSAMVELMRSCLADAGILLPAAAEAMPLPLKPSSSGGGAGEERSAWRLVHVLLIAFAFFFLGRLSAGAMATAE